MQPIVFGLLLLLALLIAVRLVGGFIVSQLEAHDRREHERHGLPYEQSKPSTPFPATEATEALHEAIEEVNERLRTEGPNYAREKFKAQPFDPFKKKRSKAPADNAAETQPQTDLANEQAQQEQADQTQPQQEQAPQTGTAFDPFTRPKPAGKTSVNELATPDIVAADVNSPPATVDAEPEKASKNKPPQTTAKKKPSGPQQSRRLTTAEKNKKNKEKKAAKRLADEQARRAQASSSEQQPDTSDAQAPADPEREKIVEETLAEKMNRLKDRK